MTRAVDRMGPSFGVVELQAPALVAPLVVSMIGRCPPGRECVQTLRVELRDLLFLAIVVLFFFIAQLLDQARRIEEDSAQIV